MEDLYLNPAIFAEITDTHGNLVAYATHDIAAFIEKHHLQRDLPQRIICDGLETRRVHQMIEPTIPVLYTLEFEPAEEELQLYDLEQDLAKFVPYRQAYIDEAIAKHLRRARLPLTEDSIPDCFVVRTVDPNADIDFRYVFRVEDEGQVFYLSGVEGEPLPSRLDTILWTTIEAEPTEVYFEDLPRKPIANILGFNEYSIEDAVLDELKLQKQYDVDALNSSRRLQR